MKELPKQLVHECPSSPPIPQLSTYPAHLFRNHDPLYSGFPDCTVPSFDAFISDEVLPQNPPVLKRKFGTVAPAPPTPAIKKGATGIGGSYYKHLRTSTNRSNYIYCALPADHVRLLFLKPSQDRNDDIVVELQAFPIAELAAHPKDYQFTALSYHWGDDREAKEILVDTTPDNQPVQTAGSGDLPTTSRRQIQLIRVKPNLHAFLEEFRDTREEVTLWVDRVCINQSDNTEKADQVSKMHIIFSTATNVVIWLGSPDEEGRSDRAMDFIGSMLQQNVEQNLKDQTTQDEYARQWLDLLSLMRRQWFSRRWIIQELALAKNAEVRCGSKRAHWRDFSDAVNILELHFDSILKLIKRRPDLERSVDGLKDIKPLGARILVNALSNMFQRNANGTIHSPRQRLESLISSLSTFQTSDPRDTIYTLLNLAQETFSLPSDDAARKRWRERKNVANPPPEPDYSKNLLDVYTDFMEWCIKESDSLDILCRRWALPEVERKPDQSYPDLVELPSWITTVHKSDYGGQQDGFGGRKMGDSFVGIPESRCYNASRNLAPVVRLERDKALESRSFDIPPPYFQDAPFLGVEPIVPGWPHHILSPHDSTTALSGTEQTMGSCSEVFLPQHYYMSASPTSYLGESSPQSPHLQRHSLAIQGFHLGKVSHYQQMPGGIIPNRVLGVLGHDSGQTTLESVPDALWRTLVADRDPDGNAPPAWYHRACMMCLAAEDSFGHMDTDRILQQGDTTKMQADYLKRVQAVCWNRSFIECGEDDSGNKLFGIAPFDVKPDDLVCILYGCSVPCILRQTPYKRTLHEGADQDGLGYVFSDLVYKSSKVNDNYYYWFIGEAFILGHMDGEAIMYLSKEDLERASQDFQLI